MLFCDRISRRRTGVDGLVDILHEVLDDPIRFERFRPQSMSGAIEEGVMPTH